MKDVAMNVLVTGIEGYLGSVLSPILIDRGHRVTGLDTGFYNSRLFYNERSPVPYTLRKDIREVRSEDFEGMDAVVHMAELSNDPAGDLAPEVTYRINHEGSVGLAELAKEAGVRRFVYMSSCSVYGVGGDSDLTEESAVNPQTAYAVCKTLVEGKLHDLGGEGFSPTMLRNATAFGASPGMRFDIVLNNLCGLAATTGEIRMISDGTPWRPLVHARDIGKAIACVIEAPINAVHDEIFNVGSNDQNYRVKEIAEVVAEVFPGCALTFGSEGADNRSYRVNFDKIHRRLPGFCCDWSARAGARQLARLFQRIGFDEALFRAPPFTRLKQLQHLIGTGQLDGEFFWTSMDGEGGILRPEQ